MGFGHIEWFRWWHLYLGTKNRHHLQGIDRQHYSKPAKLLGSR